MRTKAPPLLPIFRSRLQGQLLDAILLEPDKASSLTDLSKRIDRDVASVQREVDRLERSGIIKSERVGRSRLVSANTESPLYKPLAQLVMISFGPRLVLAEEIRHIKGVEEAYIFGSWARRYNGVDGPAPRDIDALVIGDPDRDDLYEAMLRAEKRLQRVVNATVRKKATWLDSSDPFVRQVRSGPLVPILERKGI